MPWGVNSEQEHVEALLARPTPEEEDAQTWTMRDGTRIKVTDMTTQHIRNALAMLRRNGFLSPKRAYRSLMYEEDTFADFERQCEVLFSPRLCDSIDWFEEELRRREE